MRAVAVHRASLLAHLVLLFAVLLTAAIPAQAASPADVTATWHGLWTSLTDRGYLYEANLTLSADAANHVTGTIHWTLRQSPRANEQAKLNLTGVEYVKGTFFPDAGVVKMNGVSLDDPNHILGVDQYRLILSDDGKVLGGITYDHGPWTGQIQLGRQ